MSTVTSTAITALASIGNVFLDAAPFVVAGLLIAGWLRLVVRAESLQRMLGPQNLRSALVAWMLGAPLPICSCGVVPVAIGLRRKKVSREALLAFLIGTPETSVGSVAISLGLLGPLLAAARVIASLLTALFAAVLSIALRTDREVEETGGARHPKSPAEPACHPEHEPWAEPVDDPSAGAEPADEQLVVGLRGLWRSLGAAVGSLIMRLRRIRRHAESSPSDIDQGVTPDDTDDTPTSAVSSPELEPPVVPLRQLARAAHRYAFKELVDDISLWLAIGIILAGLAGAFVPQDWVQSIPGGTLGAMLFVLGISTLIYACAVESTPVAASLIFAGLSPGAALVFLLAGPATNLTTILLLRQHFGRRFLVIYLSSVMIGSMGCGFALDGLVGLIGWQLPDPSGTASATILWQLATYVCAVFLLLVMAVSFWRIGWRGPLAEAVRYLRDALVLVRLLPSEPGGATWSRRLGLGAVAATAAVYGLSGFYAVPLGSAGFEHTLGRLDPKPRPPGLHYHWPWPVGRAEIFRVELTRKTDVGFRTDIEMLRQWKEAPLRPRDYGWHSFFTTMHANPDESTYLMGDEFQVELKFSVHYRVRDPLAYFYGYAKDADLVALTAESVVREVMARERIDELLTTGRGGVAPRVIERSQALLDRYGIGVELRALHVVDLHPPEQAVAAFRDVASAMEDLQTRIYRARAERASALPSARGRAAKTEADAEAFAIERENAARARAESFSARAEAYVGARAGTRFRMRIEALERVLPGKNKIVAPPRATRTGALRLWPPAR